MIIKSCYVTTERLSKRKIQLQVACVVSCILAASTVSYIPATQSLALMAHFNETTDFISVYDKWVKFRQIYYIAII